MMQHFMRKIIILSAIGLFLFNCPPGAAGDLQSKQPQNVVIPASPRPDEVILPGLSVNPGNVNFAVIGPDSILHRLVTFNNTTGENLPWAIDFPEGWVQADNNMGMAGNLKAGHDYMRLSLKSDKGQIKENEGGTKVKVYTIKLQLEINEAVSVIQRELPVGDYQEPVAMLFPGGAITVNIRFSLLDAASLSPLLMEPPLLDFGSIAPGKQLSRQIKITNKERETTSWRFLASARPEREKQDLPPLREKYISFLNESNKSGAAYLASPHLKEAMELAGKWLAQDGYPVAYGPNNIIKYHFSGTGIAVYLGHSPEGGRIGVYLDDLLVYVYDGNAPDSGREELPIVDDLPNGPHVLALVNGEGRAVVEGLSVYGKELKQGPPGWVSVLPPAGSTTRETDYVTVQIDTKSLAPGFYVEQITLASSRGDLVLEAQVEITADQSLKYFDVYRFVRQESYLYTINPQAEAERLKRGNFLKEGIAYRLFPPEVPGTTKFYRWYNASKQDFFYSYDLNGGGKSLQGYTLEGSIGNIATSKLSNTRELYRWYQQKKGRHFYTTVQSGEGMAKKGYKFDGIAGYVK